MTRNDKPDSLGLGRIGDFDLAAMLEPSVENFREIALDLISEDGQNPRRNFDQETLEELAETIRGRGVITPISVRPDPDNEGRYIVNHGHRRLRASQMAGLPTIPAFIDTSFQDEDRIIENIQRDNLGMYEIAAYIDKKLQEGFKQKEIAQRIGKSTAYVSNHVQLLNLPPCTGKAVAQGKVADLTTITDLVKLEKRDPAMVASFLAGRDEASRTAVRNLRAQLDAAQDNIDNRQRDVGTKQPRGKAPASGSTGQGTKVQHKDSWRGGHVVVEFEGRRGLLNLDKRPHTERHVWVYWEDGDTKEDEVVLEKLTLLAVVQK